MKYEGTVYRPPSEGRSLIIQVTIGCSHNQCTFCTMYKDKVFRIRNIRDICKDLLDAHEVYGDKVRRIFLADGDALMVKTEMLLEILATIKTLFPSLERVTSYGTPADILRKSESELRLLKQAGLEMIYLGAESGDDATLRRVNKGVTGAEIIRSGKKLKDNGIASSITLISGLGGQQRMKEHAIESARLISQIHPEYVGFLTLMLEESAPIYREIITGKMSLLAPMEVIQEMILFLEHVDSEGTIFRSNHASNYVSLKGTLNQDIPSMLSSLSSIQDSSFLKSEHFRSL